MADIEQVAAAAERTATFYREILVETGTTNPLTVASTRSMAAGWDRFAIELRHGRG